MAKFTVAIMTAERFATQYGEDFSLHCVDAKNMQAAMMHAQYLAAKDIVDIYPEYDVADILTDFRPMFVIRGHRQAWINDHGSMNQAFYPE